MTHLKYHLLFTHKYLTEMFPLLMFGSLINILNTGNHTPHITSMVIIFLGQLIISRLIVKRFNISYIYLLVPVSAAVMFMLDYYWLTAILIPALSLYRLEQLHDSIENTLEHAAVVTAFSLLILINMLQVGETVHYINVFHIIFIVMIVFYFLGKIIVLLSDNRYSTVISVKLFAVLTILILASTAVLSFVYPVTISTVHFITSRLLYGFSILISPLFNWFENLNLEPPEVEDEETQSELGDGEIFTQEPSEPFLSINGGMIISILLITAVVIIIVLYFKKRGALHKNNEDQPSQNIYRESVQKKTEKRTVPDHRVRKEYFDFEKWLAKQKLGRYHDETINEWIKRLNLESVIPEEEINNYLQYRYKDTELSDEAFKEFRDNIKIIKKRLSK